MEKYEKGKELGRGTFGAVYAARRKHDGLQVAIKRVHAGLGSDGVDFTALREIAAMSRCDSEHVVRLVDVFAGKDKIFVVMELLALDLHRVISNRAFPLTLGHAKAYAAQMLAGLAHLHARWVAHRDVKWAVIVGCAFACLTLLLLRVSK
jgi:serine/threonine protein kinase